ncbi:MAG: hypothetical protein LBG07_06965 [Treponema sp.]|jgi:hypothetical protein|nr:hypothetical protein [Treponema sp.]
MTKTLEDYLGDPDLADEPEALREVHAIRLKLHEERKGMTAVEYNAMVHQRALAFLARQNAPDASGAAVIE